MNVQFTQGIPQFVPQIPQQPQQGIGQYGFIQQPMQGLPGRMPVQQTLYNLQQPQQQAPTGMQQSAGQWVYIPLQPQQGLTPQAQALAFISPQQQIEPQQASLEAQQQCAGQWVYVQQPQQMAGQPFLQPGQLSQQGVVLQTQQPGQWVTRSGLQQPQQFQQIQAGQVQHAFPPGEAPYGQVPLAYTPQVQQEIGGQLGQFATTGTFGIPQHVQFSIQRKGPKNYARSDERMREVICECLIQDMTLDVSDVTIEVQKGCVSLNGTVPTRHMKYCIEDIVDKCWGVQEIENDLHVRPCDESGMSSGVTGHMSMQSGGGFAGASTASPTSRSSGADLRARDKEM